MVIVRVAIVLFIIAAFLLLLAFIVTRNQQYLTYLKQLARYAGWFAVLLIAFFVVSRVIRI